MAEYQNKTERALKNRWMDLKNRREELTMITCGNLPVYRKVLIFHMLNVRG